jgi:hypothetical protein
MMSPAHDNRGVVLQFPGVRRPLPGSRRPLARSFPPGSPPPGGDGDGKLNDEKLNKEWDLLIRVASHAWSWRDPESLDTLENAVTRLRAWVARDWSA